MGRLITASVLISSVTVHLFLSEHTEQGEWGSEHGVRSHPEHPEGGGGEQAERGGAVAGVQHPGHGRVLHGHHLSAGGEATGKS